METTFLSFEENYRKKQGKGESKTASMSPIRGKLPDLKESLPRRSHRESEAVISFGGKKPLET